MDLSPVIFATILRYESRVHRGSIHEKKKKTRTKISCLGTYVIRRNISGSAFVNRGLWPVKPVELCLGGHDGGLLLLLLHLGHSQPLGQLVHLHLHVSRCYTIQAATTFLNTVHSLSFGVLATARIYMYEVGYARKTNVRYTVRTEILYVCTYMNIETGL